MAQSDSDHDRDDTSICLAQERGQIASRLSRIKTPAGTYCDVNGMGTDGVNNDAYDSHKRTFSISSGQSAEQYMSQLLTRPKRHRLAPEEDLSDEDEDQDAQLRHAGYIKKLTLKNFMCHDYFELSFGRHMNFIIGRNGSGKSAVLTGISVGLGAKATDTNRGSSAKRLIKDGKSTARIIVEIENDGLNAYEPEIFGKSIYVERKLSREGTNSYAIKSENGSVVSNKKKTLDDILHRFFIVVNNPLSFLSQDKAREFIANSTEQSRYAYFSEGTNIRSIILNYEEASQNIHKLQSRLVAARTYFKEATARYTESERLYRKYKQSHTLRQQLEKIHGKIYWFNVEMMKKMIAKKKLEITEKKIDVQETDEIIKGNGLKIEQEREKVQRLSIQKQDLEEELEAKKGKFTEAESMYDEAARNVQSVVSDLKTYKKEIQHYSSEVKKHEADLAVEQKKIDDANGGSKQAMCKRLELLTAHQDKLVSSREQIQQQLSGFASDSPQMIALDKELSKILNAVSAIREKMASVEKAKSDRYAAFGLNSGRLVREIERETAWHSKPIGPVGCYVSVKPNFAKWGDLINATLQRQLDSFVVCDEHDRKVLNNLMRRNKVFKGIIVRKFEKFNISNQILSRYSTMLDALEFQNDDARFTLIDSAGLEEFVICESLPDAERVTKDHHVKQAYCINDRVSGIRLSRRDGQLSRDPIFYSRDLRKLAGKVDGETFAQDLDDLKNLLASLQRQKSDLHDEERSQKMQLEKQLEKTKTQLKTIKTLIFQAQESLNEEGDYERIANLNLQIELCQNQIQTREGMSVELMKRLADAKSDLQTKKEFLEQEKQAKKDVAHDLAKCEAEINVHLDAVQILKADIESATRKINVLSETICTLELKLTEESRKEEELIRLAEERCARLDVTILDTDTSKSITAEYKTIQQAIEEMENQHEKSFEDVQRELLNAKSLKDKCEQTLTEVDNAKVNLENDLNSRFENLNITIQEKLTRAKQSFEQSLALRGFKGKLEFDFKNKRVVTEVQTEDNKETRAVLSLSGGEKSFTQIAFLLSIWKIMKPRVCGLDEFDVFMDSVNRTIAIRLLVHELRGSTAQSIFITPQDIAVVGDLQDSEDVKIHVILPPRSK